MTPIEAEIVTARVRVKLDSVRGLLEAERARKLRREELDSAVRAARNGIIRAFERPAGVGDDWWTSRETSLRNAHTRADRIAETLNAEKVVVSILSQECAELCRVLTALSESAVLPPPPNADQGEALRQRLKKLFGLQDTLTRLTELIPALGTAVAASARARARLSHASNVIVHLQQARKATVQDIYEEIGADIENIYRRVHPLELLGDISLEVKTSGQGSAALRGSFYEKRDQDPRAYFSEAHLDTLGLCVFLALRKRLRRETPLFDLVVLDDVLTSVDAPHASRIAEVLLTDFKDYQVLVTTHNRVWYEHLRGLIASKSLDESFMARTIHQWSLEGGPDVRQISEERDDLAREIQGGSRGAIASGAGRLLEQLLSEMRFELALAVPAQRGERYTLGDVWPKFKSKIKTDYKGLQSACFAQVSDIDRLMPVRSSVGAHYNEWAEELSIQDAKGLASAVLGLLDVVQCRKCGRFVSRSKTPDGQVSCKCGHLRHFQPKV